MGALMRATTRSAFAVLAAATLLSMGGGIALAESAAAPQACVMRADKPNVYNK